MATTCLQKVILLLVVLQIVIQLVAIGEVSAGLIDCYPIAGATKEKCNALGCIWAPFNETSETVEEKRSVVPDSLEFITDDQGPGSNIKRPWCYYPDTTMGYESTSWSDSKITLKRSSPSALGNDVKNVTITAEFYHNNYLAHLTVSDSNNKRFVPELPKLNFKAANGQRKPLFKTNLRKAFPKKDGNQIIVFELIRIATNAVIFSTDLSKLIFADRFIQLNTDLGTPYIYGLGEHYDNFQKYSGDYKAFSFWNTDRLPLSGGTRSYGSFPFFVSFDSKDMTHAYGIYLHNSNAKDIILQDDQSLTFRTIGGQLDLFVFVGPTPLEVVQQYQKLVGLPHLPPRWSLGFHLCRYNYNSLEKTKQVWQRTREAGIPFDVQWNDVDAMERSNDFSYATKTYAGLPEFVDELHSKNMHYIPLIDPGISQESNYRPYDLGTQMDIWIKNSNNKTLVGKVWNQSGRTVFPDFSNPGSHEYWAQMFKEYQQLIKYDGAWIDMNDISNFVDGSIEGCPDIDIENPPYAPGGYRLQTKSLCLSARHKAGLEYDVHSLYSFYEAIATKAAVEAARPGRRTLVISRSSSPGQGQFSGHWSGDVQSNWNYLRWSIPSLLEHSMYGYSMMGSDICGFAGNTTPQLCARWSTLGAFYTFSRNHNDDTSIDQDPVALGPVVVAANKNAYTKRYSLLPYLYTLIYNAHKSGTPVVRPVAFEFFNCGIDAEAFKLEEQFMWGSAIMIAPIVHDNSTNKKTYLPPGRWYQTDIMPRSVSFDAKQVVAPKMIDVKIGGPYWHLTTDIELDNLPLFYRGGHIVPVYAQVGATVADTERGQPISLEVVLGAEGTARGELILDDGESLKDAVNYVRMAADNKLGEMRLEVMSANYQKEVTIGKVKVMGVSEKIGAVVYYGQNMRSFLNFQQVDHLLIFDLANLGTLSINNMLILKWYQSDAATSEQRHG